MEPLDAETRAMVGQTLQRFVAAQYEPAARLRRLKAGTVDHRLHWPLLAELGLPGLITSADHGGLGGAAVDLAHAVATMAPGLVLEPVVEVLVSTALLAAAPGALLDAVVAGERIVVPLGLSPGQPPLRLATHAGTLRLTGTCVAVFFAAEADEWLVAARDADGGAHLLAMPAAQPGATVSRYRLMDGRPAADVAFDGGPLREARTLLQPPAAEASIDAAADLWLAAVAADAVGLMDHLFDTTRDYLRTRVQFGVAIGSFQALQHRLADMRMAGLEARALLRSWTQALDAGAPAERLSSLRRALPRIVVQAGRLIGHEAIQMHGGMGLTEELGVSHCNARLRVIATQMQGLVQGASGNEALAA